jgi:FtsP/CotA-like multicopper oxidase with cupredoxin domain
MRYSPAPAVTVNAVAYNGAIPGPVLRVREGQRIAVAFRNASAIATTVHWHGMVLPNAMDGAAGVTQPAVMPHGRFEYAYAARPAGTRWYHDHAMDLGALRGLFGMIVVEDPKDEAADKEFAIVFHDVPDWRSVRAALAGTSNAPMIDPMGSIEMQDMRVDDRMGDEVRYLAHCINGATYPNTQKLRVAVGDRVRLRILNASGTQTRYVALAGHQLRVTHTDGNPVPNPTAFDVVRIGVAERYDAWFTVTKPGAWSLQGLSSDPLAYQQSLVIYTDGHENDSPLSSSESIEHRYTSSYDVLAGGWNGAEGKRESHHFELGGGKYGSNRWTMNGAVWPHIPPILVHPGARIAVTFRNTTDMDHPMHLHGHTFKLVAIDGRAFARPLLKDVTLVGANGGTATWIVDANGYPGRWLLHCHNDIHMMDGMMTELRYI